MNSTFYLFSLCLVCSFFHHYFETVIAPCFGNRILICDEGPPFFSCSPPTPSFSSSLFRSVDEYTARVTTLRDVNFCILSSCCKLICSNQKAEVHMGRSCLTARDIVYKLETSLSLSGTRSRLQAQRALNTQGRPRDPSTTQQLMNVISWEALKPLLHIRSLF